MATIKSYTDLEQSKVLATILPIESADMYTIVEDIVDEDTGDIISIETTKLGSPRSFDIPCWSLASLLEEIPEIINFDDDESDYALEILKEGGLYYLSYGNPLENSKIEIEPQENFVDACVAMIEKLNELNLL